MTKTKAKHIALDMILTSIGTAYYKLEDTQYNEEDTELISDYILKLGTRACKSLGSEYITY